MKVGIIMGSKSDWPTMKLAARHAGSIWRVLTKQKWCQLTVLLNY